MSTIITIDENGLFRMKSSVSNEYSNEGKPMTENQIKKNLMNIVIWDAIDKVNKIYQTFPEGYTINGKRTDLTIKTDEYYDSLRHNSDNDLIKKFNEISTILNLGVTIT